MKYIPHILVLMGAIILIVDLFDLYALNKCSRCITSFKLPLKSGTIQVHAHKKYNRPGVIGHALIENNIILIRIIH